MCAGDLFSIIIQYNKINVVFDFGVKSIVIICSLILLSQSEIDLNTGRPLDNISAEALPILSGLGCDATKVSEIIDSKNKGVYDAIQQGLDKANQEAVSHAQKVVYSK